MKLMGIHDESVYKYDAMLKNLGFPTEEDEEMESIPEGEIFEESEREGCEGSEEKDRSDEELDKDGDYVKIYN